MENKDVDFIAQRYRKGRFSSDAGWLRLGIAPISHWRRFRVSAAVAATVILSATAAIIYREYSATDIPQKSATISDYQTVNIHTPHPMTEIKTIDFEDARLKDVVKKIETVYNVKVENLPDNTEDYVLSLHYEGTPTELISVINDILGTQMSVTEK